MKSHESDAMGLLSETTTMEQIVQRCVTDQKFWPHNVLDQLLVHRLVPNRSVQMSNSFHILNISMTSFEFWKLKYMYWYNTKTIIMHL